MCYLTAFQLTLGDGDDVEWDRGEIWDHWITDASAHRLLLLSSRHRQGSVAVRSPAPWHHTHCTDHH